jgi:hypothetical protein
MIVKDGKLEGLEEFEGKEVEVKEVKNLRSLKQNRSLYKYFSLLSEELNHAGFDMRHVIRENLDIPWTPDSIKYYLWKPVMKSMFGIESTREMTTPMINDIYDVINKTIGERTLLHIPFPTENYDEPPVSRN